tara:strand:+ start:10525 stop:11550 length:1026 start_codon:yes stop_codon:yes gene_type:complete
MTDEQPKPKAKKTKKSTKLIVMNKTKSNKAEIEKVIEDEKLSPNNSESIITTTMTDEQPKPKAKKKTLKKKDKHNPIECSPPPEQSTSSTNRRQSGSDIAKKGYEEEHLVCYDLNNNEELRKALKPILGDEYDECVKVPGTGKIDIKSKNGKLLAQVKKGKLKQIQQVNRNWVSHLIKAIPELESCRDILVNLCEKELLADGKHVDKSKPIQKLDNSNYTKERLDDFLKTLNANKKKILEYAFYGTNDKIQPNYLIGVEYRKSDAKRHKVVAFKIIDIIEYLETQEFIITEGKTVINLGDEGIFGIKRKGGDKGEKRSNHLHIIIKPIDLINKVSNSQYKL